MSERSEARMSEDVYRRVERLRARCAISADERRRQEAAANKERDEAERMRNVARLMGGYVSRGVIYVPKRRPWWRRLFG